MFVNPFPTMFLALVAHAILRIIFGLILMALGYRHLFAERQTLTQAIASCVPRLSGMAKLFAIKLAIAELLLGAMFVFGFYTQIAALGTIIYAMKMLFFRKHLNPPLMPTPAFFALAIGVCLSLFITGAGVFALDIPL